MKGPGSVTAPSGLSPAAERRLPRTIPWTRLEFSRVPTYCPADLVALLPAPDSVDPAIVREVNENYERVKARFTGRDGKVRRSWCRLSVAHRAESVGLGEMYRTCYPTASHMDHMDVMALNLQIHDESWDVDVAPAHTWLREALVMGHMAFCRAVCEYNEIAGLGFDEDCQALLRQFRDSWGDLAASSPATQ